MDTLLDEYVVDEHGVEQLDFELLPCEGVHPDRGLSGHDPAESGGYLVISPCCGPKVIQCGSRVDAMRTSGVLYCAACQHEHLTSEYFFVPLQ
jgi:hypothetical protein